MEDQVGTCLEWTCNSFLFFEMTNNIDLIFHVLGNKSRRDILALLANEPLYFNQVSKQIGIGQQAMLRHMQALADTGFVSTYDKKSTFGAPDRKYYRLNSSFNLSISLSEDEFSIDYNEKNMSDGKSDKLFGKRFKQISNDPSLALDSLRADLSEMDEEIQNLQSKINDLKSIRQVILQKIHQIGDENFEEMERKIIYNMMRNSPSSLTELSQMINENKSEVKIALNNLQNKIAKSKMKTLVEEIV